MVMLVGSSRIFQGGESAIFAYKLFKIVFVLLRHILTPNVYIGPYPVVYMGCGPCIFVVIQPTLPHTSVCNYEQLVVRKSLAVKISNPIKQRLHPRLNIVKIFMLV